MVLPSLPGRNLPPMKIPVCTLIFPFQEGVSSVYSKQSALIVGVMLERELWAAGLPGLQSRGVICMFISATGTLLKAAR